MIGDHQVWVDSWPMARLDEIQSEPLHSSLVGIEHKWNLGYQSQHCLPRLDINNLRLEVHSCFVITVNNCSAQRCPKKPLKTSLPLPQLPLLENKSILPSVLSYFCPEDSFKTSLFPLSSSNEDTYP